jgi:hypothetical protein
MARPVSPRSAGRHAETTAARRLMLYVNS